MWNASELTNSSSHHRQEALFLPALAAVQALILIGSLVGNLVVIIVFRRKLSLLTPSNCLVLNLALTNLAMALIVMPPVLVSLITDRWLFGHAVCQIVGLSTSVLLTSCIFTLVLISLDRYCAILQPLRYSARVTQARIRVAIVLAWVLSIAISTPPLFGWNRFSYQREKHTCTVDWKTEDSMEKLYTLVLTVVCFISPFLIMIYVYAAIVHAANANNKRARRSSSISEPELRNTLTGVKQPTPNGVKPRRTSLLNVANSLGQSLRKEEWKAAKTSLFIVFAFGICWIPFFSIIILNSFQRTTECIPWCLETLSVVLMLLDCMLNPIVYVFKNRAMRTEIVNMVRQTRPESDRAGVNREAEKQKKRFARRCMSEPSPSSALVRKAGIGSSDSALARKDRAEAKAGIVSSDSALARRDRAEAKAGIVSSDSALARKDQAGALRDRRDQTGPFSQRRPSKDSGDRSLSVTFEEMNGSTSTQCSELGNGHAKFHELGNGHAKFHELGNGHAKFHELGNGHAKFHELGNGHAKFHALENGHAKFHALENGHATFSIDGSDISDV